MCLIVARFLEHALRLLDDAAADRRHGHFAAAALEQRDAELVFELLHRDRQRRLAHEALLRGAAEVALARKRDDVAKLGEGHMENRVDNEAATGGEIRMRR